MKKSAIVAGLVIIAMLGLSSCDAMFETNVFKALKLGQVDLKNISSAAEINQAASSPQFFVDLKADPATANKFVATLVPGFTSAAGDTTAAAANTATLTAELKSGAVTAENLVLASAIMIKSTEAGTIVDNIAGQLTTIADSGSSGELDTAALITAILPADVKSDKVAFTAAINALIDASSGYSAVATNSYTAGVGTNPDTYAALPAIEGSASQDTAYYGLVALAVSAVSPTDPTRSTADVLFDIVNNVGTATSADLAPPDPAVFDINAPTGTAAPSTAYILLQAAGIDLSGLGTN